ncbi:hypothetical protein DM558_00475 [Entomomonas moraniae]|uniref:Uncharacterized protein n=2 Tax=Entomomonas moraniae TaxID=2213226 RepID=A0A3S9XA67_9GAMM|nr:hypothetical protein DM558_00475 [Entomomonas moraniae]
MKVKTKKALSARTPKARLTLIPTFNRNIAMKNSTALNLNNQPLSALEYKVKDQSEFMQKAGRSINAITQCLQISFSNYCDGIGDVLPENEISSLLEAIDLLSADLENRACGLETSLVNGGF